MKRKLIPSLLAAALVLGACDDSTGTGGAARVSLLLTDAPGDFRSAVVTITDIYFQPAEGEDAQREYLLQDGAVTTDLLSLSNDVLEIVDDETVPAGRYEQLRFVISGAYVEVIEAEDAEGNPTRTKIYATSPDYAGLPAGAQVAGTLKCPSCDQSGLKVLLPGAGEDEDGAVEIEGEQVLLVDFDVSQSFGKQAGNSGMWIMRPTLKATRMESAASVLVTLDLAQGVSLPSLDGGTTATTLGVFNASLTPAAGGDAKTVAFTDSDNNGVFEARFGYLWPGEYRLGLLAPEALRFAVGYLADPSVSLELPVSVTVNAGQEAKVEFRLTSAALK